MLKEELLTGEEEFDAEKIRQIWRVAAISKWNWEMDMEIAAKRGSPA